MVQFYNINKHTIPKTTPREKERQRLVRKSCGNARKRKTSLIEVTNDNLLFESFSFIVMIGVGEDMVFDYKIMINEKGKEIVYAAVFEKQRKPTYAQVVKKNRMKNVVMNLAEEKKN